MKKKPSFLEVIKYIYVYFFSAVGTVMIIIGIYQFGEYLFNSNIGPVYRLESYREEQCDYADGKGGYRGYPEPVQVDGTDTSELTNEEVTSQHEICLENLADERAYEQKKDLFNAAMLTGLGLIVFAIHFGWMRNKFLQS